MENSVLITKYSTTVPPWFRDWYRTTAFSVDLRKREEFRATHRAVVETVWKLLDIADVANFMHDQSPVVEIVYDRTRNFSPNRNRTETEK